MPKMEIFEGWYASKIGLIKITGTENGISSVSFLDDMEMDSIPKTHPALAECLVQIDAYFKGKRKEFQLRLDIKGTAFQKQVWNCLRDIPYGKTVSYQDVAVNAGNPKACRAVGGANGKNPVPIIIPCHRAIRKNGDLGGFGSGVWRKTWLLEHERKFSGNPG